MLVHKKMALMPARNFRAGEKVLQADIQWRRDKDALKEAPTCPTFQCNLMREGSSRVTSKLSAVLEGLFAHVHFVKASNPAFFEF